MESNSAPHRGLATHVRYVAVLGPTFTTSSAAAGATKIPTAKIHVTGALGLRGKNGLHAGKDIYGCYFRRARASRTEYDNGLPAFKIVKRHDRHILKRLTKIAHAAVHPAPTSAARASTAKAARTPRAARATSAKARWA